MKTSLHVLVLAGLLACRDDGLDTSVAETLVPLEDTRLLRRIALDLTGELPTLAELEAVEADPAQIEALRDGYLEDERLEERLVYLLAEHWLTTRDEYDIYYYDYNLDEDQEYPWERSVGQEPLRLIARLIANDEHWGRVATADFTMATEITAALWPVEGYPTGDAGWSEVSWTDSRPPVGVLATNGLWWRYTSNDYNANRARVAAISRVLTCEDLLQREVTFENTAALLDADSVTDMVQTNESCLACHATVEPMAAALFGFQWITDFNPTEMERYHPEREPQGEQTLHVEMAYWGEPITGLEELGWAISRDERLYSCMAETMTRLLFRRQLELHDRPELDLLLQTFIEADARVKPLIRKIMALPAYQAGGFTDAATEVDQDRELVTRALSPQQLASTVEALTGFRWTSSNFDQMDNDTTGFRVLMGGVDGEALTLPVNEPTLTSALVVKRLAEAAASWEASSHLGDGGTTLLGGVSADWSADDPALGEAVAAMYFQLTAVRPDTALVGDYVALYGAVADSAGAQAAWTAVLAAMLRETDFITY